MHFIVLYPQNGDRVVSIDSVTSFNSMYQRVVQQVKVTELEHYGQTTCNKLCASSHAVSSVVCVVNKLDRRRVLLTTRSTCSGEIF